MTAKNTAPISLYRKIAYSFLGVTLAVIAVILYFSLATATIRIIPVRNDFPFDFLLTLKPDGESLELVDNQVIVDGKIFETTKEIIQEFETTVVSDGEPAKAGGAVTLINKSSRSQPLVATTRLLSKEGVLFRMVSGATVPANGEIDVKVLADKPGRDGEIGPSEFIIPGLNPDRQKDISGISLLKMTGGTKSARMFSEADLKTAQETLSQEIAKQALVQWSADLPGSLKILEPSIYSEVLSAKADQKLNAKVDAFNLTLKARVVAVAVSENEIYKLALKKMKTAVPKDYELNRVDESSFKYATEKYDLKNGTLTLRVNLAGKTQLRSNSPILDRNKLSGQLADEAIKYLKTLPGIAEVDIKLQPFWLKKIPLLRDHIRIIIDR